MLIKYVFASVCVFREMEMKKNNREVFAHMTSVYLRPIVKIHTHTNTHTHMVIDIRGDSAEQPH